MSSTWLEVDGGHAIHIKACGNKRGRPVLFLHGGPGAGCSEEALTFFDLNLCRVYLLDQRGCGLSRPTAEVAQNTTWDLVADCERVREHFGVERWLLFGGSWGSTLALTYAMTHPDRVWGMVLRGIFLARPKDISWLTGHGGAARLYPERFNDLLEGVSPDRARNPLDLFYENIVVNPGKDVLDWCRRLGLWELGIAYLDGRLPSEDLLHQDSHILAMATLMLHYLKHSCFIDQTDFMAGLLKLKNHPCEIVHGRYDIVCPPDNAYELHRQLPKSRLHMVNFAGHAAYEPGIAAQLRISLYDMLMQWQKERR